MPIVYHSLARFARACRDFYGKFDRIRENEEDKQPPRSASPRTGTLKKQKKDIHMDILLHIGVTGLEPAASWSRTKHSTKLSHTPTNVDIIPQA